MANESCDPVKPGTRMVKCVKFGKELPGLDRIPWQGELGKRVYENVSKDAWKLWLEYSKMVMNEYRLNPLDPNSQFLVRLADRALHLFGRVSSCKEKTQIARAFRPRRNVIMKARGDDQVGNKVSRARGFHLRNAFHDAAVRNRNHHHAGSFAFPRRVAAGHPAGVAQEQFLEPHGRLRFARAKP